eukprot:TRINITY_DN210_c0_g1_i1.p1 TRINITY_DN210_c0_g1~~TRINITY_DN210_c0_g1_i1.p1  ORF type:complete len:108 (+),score=1.94 TRINITY_DN210_c0_g1_i1:41-364(+)
MGFCSMGERSVVPLLTGTFCANVVVLEFNQLTNRLCFFFNDTATTEIYTDSTRNPTAIINVGEVDISTIELLLVVTSVDAIKTDPMFLGNSLPKFGTELITALADLN